MPWDSDAKDLINAAKEDVNCSGARHRTRGEAKDRQLAKTRHARGSKAACVSAWC